MNLVPDRVKANSHNNRVVILSFPFASASIVTPVSKMARVISTISSKTILIGSKLFLSKNLLPGEIQIIPIRATLQYANRKQPIIISVFRWAIMNIYAQLEMGWLIWKVRHDVDVVLCAHGCYYQIPCIIAKLLGKQLICSSFGVDSDIALINHGRIVSNALLILSAIIFSLADKIIVDCRQSMESRALKPFSMKIFIGHRFEEDLFHVTVPLNQRKKIIGFIGRISTEKGIVPLLQAMPAFLQGNPDASVLIIGSGNLDYLVERELAKINQPDRVEWKKWVNYEEIPDYLNQMQLLILPSYTEGIPNVITEAMACGTPVLATSVGGIPNIIIDGVSGFILKNNSAKEIVLGLNRSLSSPNISQITERAIQIIKEEFSFSACAARYRRILCEK